MKNALITIVNDAATEACHAIESYIKELPRRWRVVVNVSIEPVEQERTESS